MCVRRIVFCSKYDSAVFYSGMLLVLGANPYCPAGTGKSESVKALSDLFGRRVLVFNCDEVSTSGRPALLKGHLPVLN